MQGEGSGEKMKMPECNIFLSDGSLLDNRWQQQLLFCHAQHVNNTPMQNRRIVIYS